VLPQRFGATYWGVNVDQVYGFKVGSRIAEKIENSLIIRIERKTKDDKLNGRS
jgi:hypothetical protein